MQLEKVIKQLKPFKHEKHKLTVNIIYTHSWLNLKIEKLFKGREVTLQQYNILRILRGQHPQPATVNTLIERMLDKMSNASRLVDKLYNKGYVNRVKNKDDRRAVDVTINQKGLDFLAEMDLKVNSLQIDIFNLTDNEAKQLNHLMDKMRGEE